MKKTIFINFIFLILLILLIEFALRYIFSFNVQGISNNLINLNNTDFRFNNPNLKNAKAFGVEVYTDKDGFRIKKDQIYKDEKKDILFVGGSVAFGPAIKAEDTFIGKLNSISEYNIRNVSVFGTTFENNIQIIKNLKSKENIEKIYISFPLDDIISNKVKIHTNSEIEDQTLTQKLKRNKFVSYINLLIRSKSASYVFVKGIVSNPQDNNYIHDINLYKNKDLLKQLNINLKKLEGLIDKTKIVFYSIPYAAQVKNNKCETKDTSEKILKDIFGQNKFEIIFLHDDMCKNKKPLELFLKNDPVHLNKKGHNYIFKYFAKIIKNQNK